MPPLGNLINISLDTITKKNKKKQQKRLLSDSMKNLHVKFLTENSGFKISYSLFCRLRPFWVTPPTERDRQTCLCKLHENCQLAISKLKNIRILTTDSIEQVLKSVSCDIESKSCMYGECPACKDPVFCIVEEETDKNAETSWMQWKTVREERDVKGVSKTVNLTVKAEVKGSVGDLIDECINLLEQMKRHHFNIRHQYRFYRFQKQNMGENECLIHIDFSENYECKFEKEVQSVHFGASKKQISLCGGTVLD